LTNVDGFCSEATSNIKRSRFFFQLNRLQRGGGAEFYIWWEKRSQMSDLYGLKQGYQICLHVWAIFPPNQIFDGLLFEGFGSFLENKSGSSALKWPQKKNNVGENKACTCFSRLHREKKRDRQTEKFYTQVVFFQLGREFKVFLTRLCKRNFFSSFTHEKMHKNFLHHIFFQVKIFFTVVKFFWRAHSIFLVFCVIVCM